MTPRTPQDRRHWLTAQSINQSVMPIMCRTVSNTIFCQIQHTHYKYLSTKLRQLITLTLKNEHEILTLSVPSQNISYPHKHHYAQSKHIKALCTLTVHNSRPFGKRPIRRTMRAISTSVVSFYRSGIGSRNMAAQQRIFN